MNNIENETIDRSLKEVLSRFRTIRQFQAAHYVKAKAILLNRYLSRFKLTAVIVGVSGGIDSAVTLAIAKEAMNQHASPMKRLIGALIPVHNSKGATSQDRALEQGKKVIASVGAEEVTIGIGEGVAAIKSAVDTGLQSIGMPWAEGQLVSYSRTPALYYLSSLVAENGNPAVVLGTTNRDEGAYIGFFGKASDAMVDLQLISDIHKSEVAAVARYLHIPDEIISATPTGDTYDGRPDEAMIGAPYAFLELYQNYLCLEAKDKETLRCGLSPAGTNQFLLWSRAIEVLHEKNLHKYLSGTSAVHLDIMERAVPGGWRTEPKQEHHIHIDKLVNPVSLQLSPETDEPRSSCCMPLTSALSDSPFTVTELLTQNECLNLIEQLEGISQVPVSLHGKLSDFDASTDPVGSWRTTAISEELADRIWKRLKPFCSPFRIFNDESSTDWKEYPVWRPIGINPVLRFISYQRGGALVPHYDAGFDFEDNSRHTLMTLVIYLTDGETARGGSTRFLRDPQRNLPYKERDFRDWDRFAEEDEVLLKVEPEAGKALIFDHRLLHDGERWDGRSARILLRTDIIFERCGPAYPESACEEQSIDPETIHPKVLLDPFYRSVFDQTRSERAVFDAGFFVDSGPLGERLDIAADIHWLETPLQKVMRRFEELREQGQFAVLLTTGAFCPVHQGHIAMMESARKELEMRGYAVLGGFLSPSHDEYVREKCGLGALSASHRIALIRDAIADSDWLAVDTWESHSCKRDVNFTETIEHLSRYLAWHVPSIAPIKVFYVFGGDNAHFAGTFRNRGGCICIPRGAHDEARAIRRRSDICNNPRIIFSELSIAQEASSTRVRAGDTSWLPASIAKRWSEWTMASPSCKRAVLRLRDEGSWLYQHWTDKINPRHLEAARRGFIQGLTSKLMEAFSAASLPDQRLKLSLEVLSLKEQHLRLGAMLPTPTQLSLDACTTLAQNLRLSRLYDLCDSGTYHGIIARPGAQSIATQLQKIPAGNYLLVDDDISTGNTVQRAAELLSHCSIAGTLSLADEVSRSDIADPEVAIADLGDVRDLLVGSFDAGLVVRLFDGTVARAPYLLPYVQPSTRLSIPYSMEKQFSEAVWRLNEEFFRELPCILHISDAPFPFQRLAHAAGFTADDPLEAFCRYHANRLADRNESSAAIQPPDIQYLTH